MFDLIVAGAGMGGLVAAVHARERGASVLVLEKGDRAGGSMLLSSGFLWRYREFDRFREECPGGDPGLQWLVHDRLDSDLAWLESVAGPALERETGNPLTTGLRFSWKARERFCSPSPCAGCRRRRRCCSRLGASRGTASSCGATSHPRRSRSGSARTPGARATASRSHSSAAPSSRAGWTSSTGGTCPLRLRASRRRASARLLSATPTTQSSRTPVGSGTRPGPGRRSTSSSGRRASRTPGPATPFRRSGSASASAIVRSAR
ncbi:MAG: FAD-dependent oxidoreductase [Actinobacteria bacterium]|nr:MAG: FAD-dependent oxidoreductase [Actinomycetota bacterium]